MTTITVQTDGEAEASVEAAGYVLIVWNIDEDGGRAVSMFQNDPMNQVDLEMAATVLERAREALTKRDS